MYRGQKDRGRVELLFATLIAGCVVALVAASESGRSSPLAAQHSNLDLNKPTAGCVGNYLLNRGPDKREASTSFYLEKIYDSEEVIRSATSQGMVVQAGRGWFPQDWSIGDKRFTGRCDLGFKLKKNDQIERGPIVVRVDGRGRVKITGPELVVKKVISNEEAYRVVIRYDACRQFKQSISITQEGRCNFTADYVKKQTKELLEQMGLETGWLSGADVEVNGIYQ